MVAVWPVAATAYVLAVYIGRVREVVTGERGVTGGGILSLLLLVALPVVDYALCRALGAAAVASKRAGAESEPGFIASYEPVLRRAIHIVVVVAGLLWIADLWNLNVFAMATQSLAVASPARASHQLVLLLAYMMWEIAKTAIDRRLATEREQPADSPSSRLRRAAAAAGDTADTIAVMTTLRCCAPRRRHPAAPGRCGRGRVAVASARRRSCATSCRARSS